MFGQEDYCSLLLAQEKAAIGNSATAGSVPDGDIVLAGFPLPWWVLALSSGSPLPMRLSRCCRGCSRGLVPGRAANAAQRASLGRAPVPDAERVRTRRRAPAWQRLRMNHPTQLSLSFHKGVFVPESKWLKPLSAERGNCFGQLRESHLRPVPGPGRRGHWVKRCRVDSHTDTRPWKVPWARSSFSCPAA